MRFHYGLGVGHVYSHEIHTMATEVESECSEREESETINWQAPADEDEEGEHIGVEEVDFFGQERNGSTESLIEALDEMFNGHVFDYEN